jgi:hypothetical protein
MRTPVCAGDVLPVESAVRLEQKKDRSSSVIPAKPPSFDNDRMRCRPMFCVFMIEHEALS